MKDDELTKLLKSMSRNRVPAGFEDQLHSSIQKRRARVHAWRTYLVRPAAVLGSLSLFSTLFVTLSAAYAVADSNGFVDLLIITTQELGLGNAADLLLAMMLSFPIRESVVFLINAAIVLIGLHLFRKLLRQVSARPTGWTAHTSIY